MGEIPQRPDPGAGAAIDARWRRARALGRMSALAGIVFAVLFVVAMVLVQRAPTLRDPDPVYEAFYGGGGDALATLGLTVVPFAGIALQPSRRTSCRGTAGPQPSAATPAGVPGLGSGRELRPTASRGSVHRARTDEEVTA